MEHDLNDPVFRKSMVVAISNYITSTKDDLSVTERAEKILEGYIEKTLHHIWLVNQCGKIFKDVLRKWGQDIEQWTVNLEFHDYDKLHDPDVIPSYAIGCDVLYEHEGELQYEYNKAVLKEFKEKAWPKHHTTNKHHVAEHYVSSKEGSCLIVPELKNFLEIAEMVADWCAMGITHGDTARAWWDRTNGKRWKFQGKDLEFIEDLLNAEDKAVNTLAWLRQFKTFVPKSSADTKITTISLDNPPENKGVEEPIMDSEEFLSISFEGRETKSDDYLRCKESDYPSGEQLVYDKESFSLEAISEKVAKNIKDGKVYHSSPFELKKLLGSKTGKWSGETGNVFVTPCKGIAACFVINKQDILDNVQEQLGGRVVGVNFGYDVWNKEIKDLYTVPSLVTVMLNLRGFKEFSGESVGYLYTVDFDKYKEHCHMFHKNTESDIEFLIEGDVDFIKKEKITAKWKCVSSEEEIKRHGEGKVISNEFFSNESILFGRDQLYIGPIDPLGLNFDYITELSKYPELIMDLKKWITVPDRDLLPGLEKLGQIVDDLYKFKKDIVCYRGIRMGLSLKPMQNLMGAFDDDLLGLSMLKPGFTKGHTFEFETPGPMSVARSPYIARIYGEFIVKCNLTSKTKKLVITNELSYLLQQIDPRQELYRAVNLSVMHEVVVFPGQNLEYTVVSTCGDISSELETTKALEALDGLNDFNGIYNDQLSNLKEHDYSSENAFTQACSDWWNAVKRDSDMIGKVVIFLSGPILIPILTIANVVYGTDSDSKDAKGGYDYDSYDWKVIGPEWSKICSHVNSKMKTDPFFAKEKHKILTIDQHINQLESLEKAYILALKVPMPSANESAYAYGERVGKALGTTYANSAVFASQFKKIMIFPVATEHTYFEAQYFDSAKVHKAMSLSNKVYTMDCTLSDRWDNLKSEEYMGVWEEFGLDVTYEQVVNLNHEVSYEFGYSNMKKIITHLKDTTITTKKSSKESFSGEALSVQNISKKKAAIIKYICGICDTIDPSKTNSKRYHRILDHMTDKEFDQWMNYVREGKWKLHIVAPNLIVNLQNENILKAADKSGCKLFHRLWMDDNTTGRRYLTDNEYLILNLPVRRQQQFLDEKMSVPDNDRQIDGLTGQVTGDSRACSITNPEIQILAARGLDATLEEFVNVRGGNIAAYAEFRRQAEETGEISLNTLDPTSKSRVSVIGQTLLRSMMIDNNIVE